MINKLKIREFINIFSLFTFVYYFLSKSSFSYLIGQPIFYPESDNFYWLLLSLNIPQIISKSESIAFILDFTIIFSSLFLLLKENIYVGIILTVTWILFFIQYNLVSFHHYHGLVSIVFLSLINCVKKDLNKWILFETIRYYFLFSFCTAALWKIFRGNIFIKDQFSNMLIVQNAEIYASNTITFQKNIILFLINNPSVSFLILILATLTELSFIVGFFTKKYDRYLLVLMLLFSMSNWLLMNIFSWQYTLFSLVLIPSLVIKKPN